MVGKKAKEPKDKKVKVLQIRLSPEDLQKLKEIAANKGVSVSDLVRTLLN